MSICKRFGNSESFLKKVNPQTQTAFAANQQQAVAGDYPTLKEINLTYGNTFAEQWLYIQIADLSLFTGAKNLDKNKVRSLASVIAAEYSHLKVTEMLLFFHRFKAGHYGRFYGSVDPMVITCALRDFIQDRNLILDQYEREQKELESKQNNIPTMTYEQWKEYKLKQQKTLQNESD